MTGHCNQFASTYAGAVLCVAAVQCKELRTKATSRLLSAFRPKTRQSYSRLFRVFISFCICINVSLFQMSIAIVVSFLEYLVSNGTSVHIVSNYVSALKAMAVIYNMQFQIFDQPQVKYFIKSLKINRPLTVSTKNILDIKVLSQLIKACEGFTNAITFTAIFLTAFCFIFLDCLIWPHMLFQNLTLQDILPLLTCFLKKIK